MGPSSRPHLACHSTIGNTTADGCAASCRSVFVAVTLRVPVCPLSPVFKFLSNRGKLLLLISSLILWPFLKTLLVDHMSTDSLYTSPGVISSGFSCESRYFALTMPSVKFCAKPFGQTSTSFAVKSVSTALDFAQNPKDDVSRHFCVTLQHWSGIHQHVIPRLHSSLIAWSLPAGAFHRNTRGRQSLAQGSWAS